MRGRIYAVHYGEDTEVTRQFVNSVQRFLGAELNLVIINNDQKELFELWLYPHVTFLDTETNLGYFGGIQYGMSKFPVDGLDYVVLCNNDILFHSDDFFHVLEEKFKVWDIIAPSTCTLDGVEQNPHRSTKPSVWRKLYSHLFFSNYLVAWCFNQAYESKKKRQAKTPQNAVEKAIFSPHGACMILSTKFFKLGGSVNHPVFLYGEEDSIAAQALQLGLRVGFVPELEVRHLESRSVGKRFTRVKFEQQKTAYRYIRKMHPQLF